MAKKAPTFKDRMMSISEKINYRYVIWIVIVLLLMGSVVFGTHRGWAELKRQPEFAVSPDSLVLRAPPDCIHSDKMGTQLRNEVRAVLRNTSIFDHDLTESIAHELRASPWITKVSAVHRFYPNHIRITAQFRQPAGIVEASNYRGMVDRWGYWLPSELYDQPARWSDVKMPTIVDDNLSSAPKRGKQWNGPGLAVGAGLTQTLLEGGILDRLEIARIDVSNVASDNTAADVVVITSADRRLKWGKTDDYDRLKGIERPASARTDTEKISMLRSILDEHPNLMGLRYVDLRFGKIYYK